MILNNDFTKPYKVGGVIENFPTISHLQYDFLLTLTAHEFWPGEQDLWLASNYPVYVLLKPGTDAEQFQSKLKLISKKYFIPARKKAGNVEADKIDQNTKYIAQPITAAKATAQAVTRAAARDDRAVEPHPGLVEQPAQLLGAPQRAGRGSVTRSNGRLRLPGIWPRRRPGQVSSAVPSKRPAERASTTCSRCGPRSASSAALSRTSSGPEAGGEPARRDRRRGGFERPALGLPPRQPAVEQRDVVVAEQPQQPPGAPGRGQADRVVDDDPVVVADAALRHLRGEALGRRDHVRQAGAGLGDVVDVEEHRARNVAGIVILPRGRGDRPAACTSCRRPGHAGRRDARRATRC